MIENQKLKKIIPNLGLLHHATVKYHKNYAYLISRDGWINQINTQTDTLVRRKKIAKSSIGLNFLQNLILVANYQPKNIVVLNQKLQTLHTIPTYSRNVGIKTYQHYLIVSLMDKDQILVLDSKKNFSPLYTFSNVGKMPFDAMLFQHLYIVGFFQSKHLGILNLKTWKYHKLPLQPPSSKPIFKIPHFGLWASTSNTVFIPGIRQPTLYIWNLKKLQPIPLIGNPIFTVCSPNQQWLAINYSGQKENYITLLHIPSKKIVAHIPAGKRIMHLKFSSNSQLLYLSSYYENQLKILHIPSKKILKTIPLPQPSGIFLIPQPQKGNSQP